MYLKSRKTKENLGSTNNKKNCGWWTVGNSFAKHTNKHKDCTEKLPQTAIKMQQKLQTNTFPTLSKTFKCFGWTLLVYYGRNGHCNYVICPEVLAASIIRIWQEGQDLQKVSFVLESWRASDK